MCKIQHQFPGAECSQQQYRKVHTFENSPQQANPAAKLKKKKNSFVYQIPTLFLHTIHNQYLEVHVPSASQMFKKIGMLC